VVAQPLQRPVTLLVAPAAAVTGPELIEREWTALDARIAARERRGGWHSGWRCFACGLFVAGRDATCGSCGYRHGGINHVAQATR
jgi:hypothetical protein